MFLRIKFTRHMIMSLLWENRWFEKEIISVLRLTRKWSSQSISNSEVFFRHFWRFELGTIISRLFLDFSKVFKNSDTLYQPFYLSICLITISRCKKSYFYIINYMYFAVFFYFQRNNFNFFEPILVWSIVNPVLFNLKLLKFLLG